ncbi:MAG: transcription antitermination factor NusB [Hyphomicrobiales bacterium]
MTGKPTSRRAVSRSAARLGVVQALYQMDIAGRPLNEVLAEYSTIRLGERFEDGEIGEADSAFLKDVVEGVVEHQRTIDRATDACLAEGWTLGRLDATLRAILRAGAYELLYRTDIPARVAVAEYVHVASAFFDERETKFVNAALDALARERRAADYGDGRKAGDKT